MKLSKHSAAVTDNTILPACGYASNSLSVVSYRTFHNKYLHELPETIVLFLFSIQFDVTFQNITELGICSPKYKYV